MERMILKHLSGSKANQVEEFSLRHHNELILGRDTTATVKYDPDRDDLVGRQHAKISRDPSDPDGFLVTDLNSRNGTFVNRQRIGGTMKLNIGDSVQLGPGGPEFVFDVEPRPASAASTGKATRIAPAMGGSGAPATRVPTNGGAIVPNTGMSPAATGGKAPGQVGKATVERMISQTVTETKKSEGRKFALIGGGALIAVLLLFGVLGVVGYILYSRQDAAQVAARNELGGQIQQQQDKINAADAAKPLTAADINDKYGKSVVYFEVAWRLINTARQAQTYHLYLPSSVVAKLNPSANINARAVPVYVQVGNTYEPVLVDEKGTFNQEIGGVHTGTGFVVTNDGFVLTNRHVAAAWMSTYSFNPQTTPPGIIFSSDYSRILSVNAAPPQDWVPANSQQGGGTLGGVGVKVVSPAEYKGVNDTLDVTLPGKESRMAAQLKQTSDRHDVALVKIDVPGQLTKAELFDNYDSLKKGEGVVILGYPAASPRVYGVIKSSDTFNQATRVKVIPDPTVTTTNIGNIIRDDGDKNKRISTMGDVIQLATGSTGSGNSGGPVFDLQGRVIGIFFASQKSDAITYAVPIRYGKEFISGE